MDDLGGGTPHFRKTPYIELYWCISCNVYPCHIPLIRRLSPVTDHNQVHLSAFLPLASLRKLWLYALWFPITSWDMVRACFFEPTFEVNMCVTILWFNTQFNIPEVKGQFEYFECMNFVNAPVAYWKDKKNHTLNFNTNLAVGPSNHWGSSTASTGHPPCDGQRWAKKDTEFPAKIPLKTIGHSPDDATHLAWAHAWAARGRVWRRPRRRRSWDWRWRFGAFGRLDLTREKWGEFTVIWFWHGNNWGDVWG